MSRVQRLTVVLVLNLALVAQGWYWLDPAVALTIAVLFAYHAAALIRTILRRRNL